MKKGRNRKRNNPWRRAGRPFSAGDWLRLLALAAAIGLLAWVGTRLTPPGDAGEAVSPVVINRVMTSNPAACYPVRGEYYDWIELVNLSRETVSLAGWRLGDTVDQRAAFELGDVALSPAGTLIVYCAPRPENLEGDALFSGFKLSANGELLALSDGRRRLMQVLEVPAMAAAQVFQRGADGAYGVTAFAKMAAADLRPAFNPDGVIISELMASNRTQLQDEDGDWPDWIELYNGSASPVDLTGWALSDDDVNQRKWVFPALTMQPGEYRVVFASGKDRRKGPALHANFKLSTASEAVRLYDTAGNVRSWVEYDALPGETSLSRLEDGAFTTEIRPTPGYENTEAGVRASRTLVNQNVGDLRINEIMANGSGSDWIELYNASDKAADLSGVGLSDDTGHPRRWQFPEGSLIPAKGYVTVLLTGKGGQSGIQNGRYCADFALAEGETAVLARPDGEVLDKVTLFEQYRNVSYGRAEGHERYRFFAEATPGAENAASFARKAADVVFSQPGGQHDGKKLTVALSAEPDVKIYYTTDGSDPTTSSTVYSGPVELKKNAVIKAFAWQEDVIPSELCVQSYILGVNHTLRLVSVSGDRAALDGKKGMLTTGIKGEGSEAYVEVYEPDGTRIVAQKCLMKLAGHSTREHEGQKGFSLRARKALGASRFNYALFSNRDYPSYKSFVMRASGQDCRQTFMRDSILSALAADTGVLYRETEVSVVYVNGRYWGVYNMRERISNEMIAQFHGWENPDDVEYKQSRGYTSESYQALLQFVRTHDLADDGNVAQLRGMMDVENYLEYVMLEMYANNQDLDNVGFYRNPKADGLWRWALFDLDLSFQLDGDNVAGWLEGDTVGSITGQDNLLFKSMMKNAALRDWFLRRMGQLLASAFSAENVTAKIQARYALLEPEMEAECKRWGWTTANWKRYVQRMARYAKRRPENLIQYLTADFRLTEAQAQDYFGAAMAMD